MNQRALLLIVGSLLLPLGCGGDAEGVDGDGQTAQGPLSIAANEPLVLCSDHADAAIATFEDPNLEEAIRAALSLGAQEDLTCGLVSELTDLTAQNAGIESLVGIQNLTRLTELRLQSNSITDISALSGLTSLTWLYFGQNSVSDISALSGLTSLTELYLRSNSITDISALSGLTSLTDLRLDYNSITDIGALSRLTGLTRLNLDYNAITDIGSLSRLTSLRRLALNGNPDLGKIQALLDNAGLGAGDAVALFNTGASCADVALLKAKGVRVESYCR